MDKRVVIVVVTLFCTRLHKIISYVLKLALPPTSLFYQEIRGKIPPPRFGAYFLYINTPYPVQFLSGSAAVSYFYLMAILSFKAMIEFVNYLC